MHISEVLTGLLAAVVESADDAGVPEDAAGDDVRDGVPNDELSPPPAGCRTGLDSADALLPGMLLLLLALVFPAFPSGVSADKVKLRERVDRKFEADDLPSAPLLNFSLNDFAFFNMLVL